MILSLKKLTHCQECGSNKTETSTVIPSVGKSLHELRGANGSQLFEIFCKECGKIQRVEIKLEIN